MQLLNELTQQYDFSLRLYNYILYVCLCAQQPKNFKAAAKLCEQFFMQKGVNLAEPSTFTHLTGLPGFQALVGNYAAVAGPKESSLAAK